MYIDLPFPFSAISCRAFKSSFLFLSCVVVVGDLAFLSFARREQISFRVLAICLAGTSHLNT